jgi:hypothetical protein
MTQLNKSARRPWLSTALWILAVFLMLTSAVHQRRTGPSYPLRGEFQVGGETYAHRLIRTHETTGPAVVTLLQPRDVDGGRLYARRYPTADAFAPTPLKVEEGEFLGVLPLEPAAGKLEYFLVLEAPEGRVRVPAEGTAILRYKDPVPASILVPHILLMFFAMLIGVRTALGALGHPVGIRSLAWITLGLMTLGGMILGPIVQKYAFGAYWTGWPLGTDLTDNKTLAMWLAWIVAVLILWKRPDPRDWAGRGAVLVASLVMMAVYLIPHSVRGSELDWTELEDEPAAEAGLPSPYPDPEPGAPPGPDGEAAGAQG